MIKDKKIYLAGSLFSESEIAQRLKEEELLKSKGFENIYNPISAPCNDKSKLPDAKDIFWGDTHEVLSSEIVIADISNQSDLGVASELGIAWACNFIHKLAELGLSLDEILDKMKKKQIVANLSDIRKVTAHNYKGNNIPIGFNQYMIGMIEDSGIITDNFNEVLKEVEERS